MGLLERLERVVLIRQREEFVLEDVSEEVLVGEFERVDDGVVVERVRDTREECLGGVQNDEAGVEQPVCRFVEGRRGEGGCLLCEGVGAVFRDPSRKDRVSMRISSGGGGGRTNQSLG